MSVTNRGAPPTSWIPWLGFALSAAGIVFTAGTVRGEVQANRDAIVELKTKQDAQWQLITAASIRQARVEARLDYERVEKGVR